MPESAREIEIKITDNEAGLKVREIMSGKLKLSSREITRCKQFEDGVMIKKAGDAQYKLIWLRETVSAGDILKVKIYEDTDNSGDVIPSDDPIDIVYEDEDLILLNKPGDMVVHPSYAHHLDSLSNALAGYYLRTGQNHVVRTIGRLDRETSGLLIFAKNRHAAAILSNQKGNMSKRKEYLAIVSGVLENEQGTIDAPIGQEEGVRMIRKVMESGKEAITHYKLVRQFEDYALVRLCLDTGRTHQIRVHMSYIGHPLLGDNLYGKEIKNSHGMKRAALHAAHLEFMQPITGKELSFEAELPEDMKSLVDF
jgi:23S rRNA pseudouridine1911/1915/1917 synthase